MQDLSDAIVDFNKWYDRKEGKRKISTPLSELTDVLKENDFRLTFRVILGTYRLTWKEACDGYDDCRCPLCDQGFSFFIENLEEDRQPMLLEDFPSYEPDFNKNNFISKHIDTIQARIYAVIEEVRKNREEEVALQHNRMKEIDHADRAMAVLSGDLPLNEL